MTWYELYEMARMECGLAMADARVTPQAGLIWLSEAQHILQSTTNAAKCSVDIDLEDTDDGKYVIPLCIKTVDEVTVTGSPIVLGQGQGFNRVIRVSLDQWHNLVTNWNMIPRLDQTKIYVTFQGRSMYTMPFNNTGTIHLHYRPKLTPYSPSNIDDWIEYGEDPTDAMQLYGPNCAFDPALTGIRAFARCKMMQVIPDVQKRLANFYTVWWQEWSSCLSLVTRDSVDYVQDTKTPYSIGGLI